MNTAQKKARALYDANKLIDNVDGLSIREVLAIALQQDRLYKVMHERADRAASGEGTGV